MLAVAAAPPRRWPTPGAWVAARVSTAASPRGIPPRSEGIDTAAAGTVAFHHDPPSALCAPACRALPCSSGTSSMATVSTETLGLHPEISFRSRADAAHGHRPGPPAGNQAQTPEGKRLLLRLGGGHIDVAGRDIGIKALIAQLVIQRCLTHARHHKGALATTASTSCGQPPRPRTDSRHPVNALWIATKTRTHQPRL
jgi:hypothetical protein